MRIVKRASAAQRIGQSSAKEHEQRHGDDQHRMRPCRALPAREQSGKDEKAWRDNQQTANDAFARLRRVGIIGPRAIISHGRLSLRDG